MASSKRTHANAAPSVAVAEATDSVAVTGRRNEGQSPADPAEMSDIERLRFEATVNGRYHTARRGWYELMHRWCMFFVVIGGAGAVAEAVGQGRPYSWMIALIPTLAGTIDLVFDFAAKAADHARLQERAYEIVSEIELSADNSDAICKRGWATIARICAQETRTMRVVHALAYNDTKEGTQDDVQDDLLVVPMWSRPIKHFFSFNGLIIKSRRQGLPANVATG